MHIHLENRSPCSILSRQDLINNISNRIDGICITDHGVLKPIKELSFQGLNVFFGAEITTAPGDILIYGIKSLPLKKLQIENIINFVHNHGGIVACAHPYSNRHKSFGDKIFNYNFDAVEVNGSISKVSNKMAQKAAKILNLPTIGGSDAHSIKQLNSYTTQFYGPIKSLQDVVKAVKLKKCKAIRVY